MELERFEFERIIANSKNIISVLANDKLPKVVVEQQIIALVNDIIDVTQANKELQRNIQNKAFDLANMI